MDILMKTPTNPSLLVGTPVKLTDKMFSRFSSFIYDQVGIKLPPAKKIMLEARLNKRLKACGFSSFDDYSDYVFSAEGRVNELVNLIDVVTTNKTDFFREPTHFDYLIKYAIPELINAHDSGFNTPFKIWSAGCSTGEEPYTMAMVLSEYVMKQSCFRFSILATDISTEVLAKAKKAVCQSPRKFSVDPPASGGRREAPHPQIKKTLNRAFFI